MNSWNRFKGWIARNYNLLINILLYGVLTLAGFALATGWQPLGLDKWLKAIPPMKRAKALIPGSIILFGMLGAIAYAIGRLVLIEAEEARTEELHTEGIWRGTLRIPLGALLAVGVYLLSQWLHLFEEAGGGKLDIKAMRGISFLVGMYANVASRALGTLADILLQPIGRIRQAMREEALAERAVRITEPMQGEKVSVGDVSVSGDFRGIMNVESIWILAGKKEEIGKLDVKQRTLKLVQTWEARISLLEQGEFRLVAVVANEEADKFLEGKRSASIESIPLGAEAFDEITITVTVV